MKRSAKTIPGKVIELHTHTLLSDGELLPSELARRYEEKGFGAVAITDHADLSNIKTVTAAVKDFCDHWPRGRIKVISGVELTHLPLEQFREAVRFCRKQGVRVIIAHGETLAEPVLPGTAEAALKAGIDILSHPGLISEELVALAGRKGIYLEISGRKGHCLGNGRLVALARAHKAGLCLGTDAHGPGDIPTPNFFKAVGLAAGLDDEEVELVLRRAWSAFAA